MFEHTFIGLGFMALAVTVMSALPLFDKTSKVIWSLMGMLLWGVWALQSSAVEAVSGGVTIESEYNSLLLVGGVFAALMLLSTMLRMFELYKE